MTTLAEIKEPKTNNQTLKLTAKDYKGKADPVWCAGCGDYGVLFALRKACAELEIKPHEILTVGDIGCSSNLPGYFNSYGMHTLHGRALAVATGAKLANHHLNVIATVGDGGTYGSGGNHLAHTARRNVDLTCIVMNNQVYGLTSGQTSPTGRVGMKTKSTPFGSVESQVNPINLAIANGASFVARGFSGDSVQLTELFNKAISHKGFALVDVMSPCPPFNCDNDYGFYKRRIMKLEEESHDVSDRTAACDKAMMWDEAIYTGVFYQEEGMPVLGELDDVIIEDDTPLAHRPLGLSEESSRKIIGRMM